MIETGQIKTGLRSGLKWHQSHKALQQS